MGDVVGVQGKKKRIFKKKAEHVNQSQATKKSAGYFGQAVKWATQLRKATQPLCVLYADNEFYIRANKAFVAMVTHLAKKDEPKLTDANWGTLKGLRLNNKTSFKKLCGDAPFLNIGNEDVKLLVGCANIPQLPAKINKAVAMRLRIMVLDWDLDVDTMATFGPLLLTLDLKQQRWPKQSKKLNISLKGNRCLMVVAGVSFLNADYEIENQLYRTAEIVDVIKLRDGQIVPSDESEKKVAIVKQMEVDDQWDLED